MAKNLKAPVQPDPDAAANAKVLSDRKKRMAQAPPVARVAEPVESTATNPLEFLTEEFDKKNFGDVLPTIERIVYGPDPLLDDPQFKERVEQFGVEEVAQSSAAAIVEKGALAFQSPLMQTALAKAIRRFGVEAVSTAFYDRVMKIPVRTVQVEVDRDDEMLGNPLLEAVQRYGSPGMAPKFLSESCIAALGMRGYRIVRQKNGDAVKVGTLIMAEIPQRIANARREKYAAESRAQVRESEQAYQDNIERAVREAGRVGLGSGPLAPGEMIAANQTETEALLGQERGAGISYEEQV